MSGLSADEEAVLRAKAAQNGMDSAVLYVRRIVAEAEAKGAAEVVARVETALADMFTWCGPYGHQGVAAFIDRRDQHLRLALRGDPL